MNGFLWAGAISVMIGCVLCAWGFYDARNAKQNDDWGGLIAGPVLLAIFGALGLILAAIGFLVKL